MHAVPFVAAAFLTARPFSGIAQDKVDFRYSPADWRTLICMPTDPVKTLVWKDGRLDNLAGLCVRPVAGKDERWVEQQLVDPTVPIVVTRKRAGSLEITEEAFVTPASADPARIGCPFVQRLGAYGTIRDWAHPTVPCEPAYRNAATGRHEVVHYAFRAAKGHMYTVVFGFCEGAKNGPGDRLLDIEIDHKRRRRLDLASEYGRDRPVLIPFEVRHGAGDGLVDLAVAPLDGCKDEWGLLNVLWVFEGRPQLNLGELLLGRSDVKPLAHVACGDDARDGVRSPSVNVVLIRMRNAGTHKVETRPEFVVEGASPGDPAPDPSGDVRFASWEATGSESFSEVARSSEGTVLRFAPQTLGPGRERVVALAVWRDAKPSEVPRDAAQAENLRRVAEAYWRGLDLPYDRIQVPDPGIQAVFDADLRCIYQNRDYKNGVPVHQVGPTMYRDLSPEDGSFLIEQALLLDRPKDALATLDYFLSFQRDGGRLWVYTNFWKENGLIIWDMLRYAQLTGDMAWLRRNFPKLAGIVHYIEALRRSAATSPTALCYGLVPDGYGDGGNPGVLAEYSNPIWCLAGLRAATTAAETVGRMPEAAQWRQEADDMAMFLHRDMLRDARKDRFGNRYVPNIMGSDGSIPPPKGQYAFLQGVYPGKVLAPADPLVRGTFSMLRAVEVEGLPQGGGWVDDGVWPYFSHFQAEALLWAGRGQEAARLLYAVANHYSPLLACWEEQQLRTVGNYTGGDMPHNWASAEFIRQIRYMLVLERGTELHLFEGMPPEWARPGMVTRMNGVLTEFGPLSLSLRVSADGKSARLALQIPSRMRPSRVVLHLDGWSGRLGTLELPTQGQVARVIRLQP